MALTVWCAGAEHGVEIGLRNIRNVEINRHWPQLELSVKIEVYKQREREKNIEFFQMCAAS